MTCLNQQKLVLNYFEFRCLTIVRISLFPLVHYFWVETLLAFVSNCCIKMDYIQRQRAEENQRKVRDLLNSAEEVVRAGTVGGGLSSEVVDTLRCVQNELPSAESVTVKGVNMELDFCENALSSCTDGMFGVISPRDILECMKSKFTTMKRSNADFDLKKFCIYYAQFFKHAPPIHLLRMGLQKSFEKLDENTTVASQNTQRKKKVKAEKRVGRGDDGEDDEVENAPENEEQDQGTSMEIQKCRRAILDKIHLNRGNPIDYWQFIFDPKGKGRTFMNMLHVNHVLLQKSKELCLVRGSIDNSLFLAQTAKITSGNAQVDLASNVFTMTDNLYHQLQEKYGQ